MNFCWTALPTAWDELAYAECYHGFQPGHHQQKRSGQLCNASMHQHSSTIGAWGVSVIVSEEARLAEEAALDRVGHQKTLVTQLDNSVPRLGPAG